MREARFDKVNSTPSLETAAHAQGTPGELKKQELETGSYWDKGTELRRICLVDPYRSRRGVAGVKERHQGDSSYNSY